MNNTFLHKEKLAKLVVLQVQFKSLYMLFASNPRLLISLEQRVLGSDFEKTPYDDVLVRWAKNPRIVSWVKNGAKFSDGDIAESIKILRKYFLFQVGEESPLVPSEETLLNKASMGVPQLGREKNIEKIESEFSGPIYFPPSRLASIAAHPELENYLRMLVVISEPLTPSLKDFESSIGRIRSPDQSQGDSEIDQLPFLRNEWRDLVNLVSSQQAPIALFKLSPPTWLALETAISIKVEEGGFHIIHFSGHGYLEGLLLEDETGRGEVVSTIELVRVLGKGKAKLVMLNTCNSMNPGEALLQAGVPAVLATNVPITDQEGALFTNSFYNLLASGKSIENSFIISQRALDRKFGQGTAEKFNLLGDGKNPLHISPVLSANPIILSNEPPGNLPRRYLFVGRARELVSIAESLDSSGYRITLITGIAGIGKSSLASEAARRFAWKFPGGSFWVSGSQGLEVLIEAIHSRFPSEKELKGKTVWEAVEILKRNSCLIVVDGFEEISKTKLMIDFLLSLDPYAGTKAIITSRSLTQELEGVEGCALISLSRGLSTHNSLKLLYYLRKRHGQEELKDISFKQESEMVDFLDGHPLALEVFVNLSIRFGYKKASSMIKNFSELTRSKLKSSLFDSVKNLEENPRKILIKLSRLPGPLSSEVIEDVCSDLGLPMEINLEILLSLNLLQFTGIDYVLPPLILAMINSQEKVEPSEEDWIFPYYINILNKNFSNYKLIKKEYLNIRTAMKIAIERERWSDLISLSMPLAEFQILFGYWKDTEEFLSIVLDNAKSVTSPKQSIVLMTYLGHVYFKLGLTGRSQSLLEEARSRQITEIEHQETALLFLYVGNLFLHTGEFSSAKEFLLRSVAQFQKLENQSKVASGLLDLAKMHRLKGEHEASIELLDRCMEIRETLKDNSRIPDTLLELGLWFRMRGRFEIAITHFRRGLKICNEIGNLPTVSQLLLHLGELFIDINDLANARSAFEQAIQISKELGDQEILGALEREVGKLLRIQNRHQEAGPFLRGALEKAVSLRNPINKTKAMMEMAELSIAMGQISEAKSLLKESMAVAKNLDLLYQIAHGLIIRGRLEFIEKNLEGARLGFQEGISLLERLESPLVEKIKTLLAPKVVMKDVIEFSLYPVRHEIQQIMNAPQMGLSVYDRNNSIHPHNLDLFSEVGK